MDKILITGSEGFIGNNLSKNFKSKISCETYGLSSDYLWEDNWDDRLINYLNLVKPTIIFHVGACSSTLETDVNYIMKRNVESTKIIVDWATFNYAKLIYSSSASIYGLNGKYPSNLYGWTKYIGEQYVIQNGGIALRYFNVYGPGEEHKKNMASVAYQMYMKNKDKNTVRIFPNDPKRDFVYIDDVVSANMYALKNYDEFKGNFYDVGSGSARSFEDVLNILEIEFSYTQESDIPNGYQFYTCSNVSKFMDLWRPVFTLEEGLNKYKKYLDNDNISDW